MMRQDLPRELRPFVDEHDRLKQWPSRLKVKRMAAAYLATRFAPDRDYAEMEVNALLMDHHTFADWALLRRVLCDWGYLSRERDGSRYWLRPEARNLIAAELTAPTPRPLNAPN